MNVVQGFVIMDALDRYEIIKLNFLGKENIMVMKRSGSLVPPSHVLNKKIKFFVFVYCLSFHLFKCS
jgi:hypothetical protein